MVKNSTIIIIVAIISAILVLLVYLAIVYRGSVPDVQGTGYHHQFECEKPGLHQPYKPFRYVNWGEPARKQVTCHPLPRSLHGSGLQDGNNVVDEGTDRSITNEDIANYASHYDKIHDTPVLETIDPNDASKVNMDFDNHVDADPLLAQDNIQYNLYATPDNNNYEVVTAADLYNMSEWPDITDKQFSVTEESIYDDPNLYAVPTTMADISNRVSLNNKDNVDPSKSDGTVYYPFSDNLDSQNLLAYVADSINNRIPDTSGIFLANNVMDQTQFFIK